MGSRKRLSMDKGWRFHLGELDSKDVSSHGEVYNSVKAGAARGVAQGDYDVSTWEEVCVPHDWAVTRPFCMEAGAPRGYKPRGTAWYRKSFLLPEEFDGKELSIEFDGVATECTVYFNGSILKRHYSAYAPFSVDITDRAHFGKTPNVLAVYVDATVSEGWWYEGAGIYRHVWLEVKEPIQIAKYGVFIKPEQVGPLDWNVTIQTTVENNLSEDKDIRIITRFTDPDDELEISVEVEDIVSDGLSQTAVEQEVEFHAPKIWDVDYPNVYEVETFLYVNNTLVDTDKTVCGFRTIAFDAEDGFILNGRRLKLFGTCNHQDHGGIGVAIPDSMHAFRVSKLKEMGCNAYRTAHGMPHEELIAACDRYGLLVLDENRAFETSEEHLEELRTMVLRDRNHPSVFMYSIFNEEPLQATKEGRKMALHMKKEIEQLDDTRYVTAAMHGGILDEVSAVDALDVCGINYQTASYDAFHEKYPDMPVFGSETTSGFSVRGCYENNEEKHEIASYDEVAADWGDTIRDTWQAVMARDYMAGAFMWTGFDYLGEPTPYEWPSVSSFFGLLDTCGFEKEGFYIAKAIFSKKPFCHVAPHWNHKGREGEIIRVMSHTNCEEAELFVNKKSYGRKSVNVLQQAFWEVEYEPGVLELVGYKDGLKCVHDVKITTGEPCRLQIIPWRTKMYNDGTDAIPFQIVAVDENGYEVPTAQFPVEIHVSGGKLLGMANGNPNCHEDFKSPVRSVFAGKCQAVIQANEGEKQLMVTANAKGMGIGTVMIPLVSKRPQPTVQDAEEMVLQGFVFTSQVTDIRPDPLVKIEDWDMNSWIPVTLSESTPAQFANAQGKYGIYHLETTIPEEINGHSPVLHFYGLWGKCEIYINGKLCGECEHEWPEAYDVEIKKEDTGKAQIRVLVQCNNIGAGIHSLASIR